MEVFEAIEKWAADEFRSNNGQIEWILSSALKKAGRMPIRKSDPPGKHRMAKRSDTPDLP